MIRKIAFVEPTCSGISFYSGTVGLNLGLPTMAALLRSRGYEADVYVTAIRKATVRELSTYDLVGISLLTPTTAEGYVLADRLKGRGIAVVLGGHHATYLPEEGLQHAPYVVRGEGEGTLPELIDAIDGRRGFESVAGLSYLSGGEAVHNPSRPLSEEFLTISPDLSLVKGLTRFARGWLSRYRLFLTVQTSRGCPHRCRYCSVVGVAGRRPRFRPLETCLHDIQAIARLSRKDIFIADDNFTVNIGRAKELVRRIIGLGLPERYTFMAQVTVASLKDQEFLALLREANFELLHVGFESVNDRTLADLQKPQRFDDVCSTIANAGRFGMRVNALFLVGADHDTEETVQETVRFAIESGVAAMQMSILTPLPGSDVYRQLAAEGRIFNRRWADYDLQHTVFFPKRMRPSVLQRAVRQANNRFYSLRRFLDGPPNRRTYSVLAHATQWWMHAYERRLEQVEKGFYHRDGCLIEEVLRAPGPGASAAFNARAGVR